MALLNLKLTNHFLNPKNSIDNSQFIIGHLVLVAKCMGKLEVILEFSLAFDSTKNTLRQRNDSCKYFQ